MNCNGSRSYRSSVQGVKYTSTCGRWRHRFMFLFPARHDPCLLFNSVRGGVLGRWQSDGEEQACRQVSHPGEINLLVGTDCLNWSGGHFLRREQDSGASPTRAAPPRCFSGFVAARRCVRGVVAAGPAAKGHDRLRYSLAC